MCAPPPAKRHCVGQINKESVFGTEAALDEHTWKVHNLYRHILLHRTLPAHARFELLVSLATGTFGMDMMPPSFLDDESKVIVDRRGNGVDCGIDHINLSKTIVGQSKRYTGSSTVGWADITKFFGAYKCLETPPKERFLATLPLTRLAGRVSVFCHLKGIQHVKLDDEDATPLPLAREAPACRSEYLALRPSQEDVLAAFHAHEGQVFTLEGPPGWGKTRVALALAQETCSRGGRVVYLVNTIDLLDQTRSTFEAAGVRAEVVTYQSAHGLAALTDVDRLIADEAHHLDREGMWDASVRRIGNACRTIKMSGKYSADTVVDHVVPYDAAIREGVVADYRVVLQYWTEGVRTKEVSRFIHETPALGPLVFVFWNSVANAEEAARASRDLLDSSAVVTGDTPAEERVRIRWAAERGDVRVMHLCGCYNEGISISVVSAVVFGDPRMSVKNVFQCQARANRLHPTKPFYRVVLPILGDADFDVVAQYVGAIAASDDRVLDAVRRLVDGLPTSRVVVDGTRGDDATCTRVVEFLGSMIRSLVDDKVNALSRMSARPKFEDKTTIKRGGEEVEFNVGQFWNNICQNWKSKGNPHLCLSNAQKKKVEEAEWFTAALSKLNEVWERKSRCQILQ